MDQRHLLKAQRSQTASHRGLPRPPYQIPGRPPLSPLIASQLSHLNPTPINTDRFPTPVFTGRIQQPHLACAGPASPHVLERQREFKDASMMQAKLAQQRAILAHQVSSAPIHGMEDRVQYVPALMPNRSPEDSLAQLRRLHQQVLSMPNQEPHVYEVPSSNRQRDVRRETPTEAELLAFGSKERLQMMEKHLLASKQLTASEQHERIVLYRDRLQQTSASQGEPSYPVVGNRLTTNRPSLFSHTDLAAAQSLNYRLFQNSAAVNARMIQEIEKLREQEHLTRHDQLIYQQKQIPSPSPRLSPQGVPRVAIRTFGHVCMHRTLLIWNGRKRSHRHPSDGNKILVCQVTLNIIQSNLCHR
ncbi:hypothetical protein BSL78_01784 [Apostichopus japonicus]|uniref:Uncharacterized protein n=1 Tax=Stichopus japonicus TaxID=307972 RepID=A0A2G8LM18_STIJA|nr:hypothetical protein BSL78_01784 [Apostichopus japonicus]